MISSFTSGRKAEAAAANYLVMRGYKIIERNWRTARCEIDVIAEKDGTAYLVEVKYRGSNNQGSGLEYITPSKLKQMRFAAQMWVEETEWTGDFQLAAIELAGLDCVVLQFIDNVF
ncbi:MAG: YraN family protein [Candidatus Saccharimonadales bacterium]